MFEENAQGDKLQEMIETSEMNQRKTKLTVIPSYEAMMEAQGGFKRGQWLAYITIVLGINSVGYIQYCFAYFILYPEYNCMHNL